MTILALANSAVGRIETDDLTQEASRGGRRSPVDSDGTVGEKCNGVAYGLIGPCGFRIRHA